MSSHWRATCGESCTCGSARGLRKGPAQAGTSPRGRPYIPMIIPLLDGLSLDGAVVTADALHTQRATADYVHGRSADFAFPVKDNQPGLFDALDAQPWRDVPVTHAATDRGHGRITTRTIQVMDAPGDLPFPHVSQACLIERHVTGLHGKPLSEIAALGVTSLTATRAGPETIAGLVRGQWAIESLHWLRDTLYREDNSTVRTRSGPVPWPRSGTWPSEPCATPGGTTPPRQPAGPAATWSGPSPSSDSHHDLETAVQARRPYRCERRPLPTRSTAPLPGSRLFSAANSPASTNLT
jgi:predicted transposase YbfD/YdcC